MLVPTDKPAATNPQSERQREYLLAYRAANPERYKRYAAARNAKTKEQRRLARELRALPEGMRKCSHCSSLKPATTEFFCARKGRPSGLASWCKVCLYQRHSEWRSRHIDQQRKKRRLRYEQDGHAIRAQVAAYRANYPDRVKATRANGWVRAKEENGPELLRRLMTSQINKSLRTVCSGGKSRRSWQTILGYTVSDLVIHLERQFTPKMNWSNRGTYWEIDHIRPVSSFEITGPDCEAFRECWGYLNLRPLRKDLNRAKSANRTHLL